VIIKCSVEIADHIMTLSGCWLPQNYRDRPYTKHKHDSLDFLEKLYPSEQWTFFLVMIGGNALYGSHESSLTRIHTITRKFVVISRFTWSLISLYFAMTKLECPVQKNASTLNFNNAHMISAWCLPTRMRWVNTTRCSEACHVRYSASREKAELLNLTTV
jgi:hypothetical protein